MRKIKFRAWDKKNKQMERVSYFDFDKTGIVGFVDLVKDFEKPFKEVILMQFTGLKDKKGREIYEGDILQLINADEEVVNCICEWGIHRREMASGSIVDIPGFSFVIKTANFHSFPIVKNYLGKHDLEIIEVIGNIYEHKNLSDAEKEIEKLKGLIERGQFWTDAMILEFAVRSHLPGRELTIEEFIKLKTENKLQ